METVFTIGYGGRKFNSFVSLLEEHGICSVVDVRRFPKSTVAEYDKENLEAKLPGFGINYVFMGDILGGFRRGGYRKYMESDVFQCGVSKLLELAKNGKTVLMCKERNDSGCHRRFILEALEAAGMSTVAIR